MDLQLTVSKSSILKKSYLVGPVNLKLNAHLTAGGVAASGRIDQSLVLVVGIVVCHHHVQHDAWVRHLQILPLFGLELQHKQKVCQPVCAKCGGVKRCQMNTDKHPQYK